MTVAETTSQAIERLWAEIDRREDELIETVAELVRRPSPLGAEAEAQAYVAEHLTASGLDVDVWDLDESIKALPNAGESGVPFPGRPNVAGTRKGTGGGRSLIVQGHIDVVSPEPIAAWSYDPWQPTIVGNRMYGRGTYDMKSGDALNMMLPRLPRDLGIQLAGDLIIQSVIEEECTGNGALTRPAVTGRMQLLSRSRPGAVSPMLTWESSGSASASLGSRGMPCRPGRA